MELSEFLPMGKTATGKTHRINSQDGIPLCGVRRHRLVETFNLGEVSCKTCLKKFLRRAPTDSEAANSAL